MTLFRYILPLFLTALFTAQSQNYQFNLSTSPKATNLVASDFNVVGEFPYDDPSVTANISALTCTGGKVEFSVSNHPTDVFKRRLSSTFSSHLYYHYESFITVLRDDEIIHNDWTGLTNTAVTLDQNKGQVSKVTVSADDVQFDDVEVKWEYVVFLYKQQSGNMNYQLSADSYSFDWIGRDGKSNPVVTWSMPTQFCSEASVVDLNDYVDVQMMTFGTQEGSRQFKHNGSNITNLLDIGALGNGSKTISVVITDDNNCSVEKEHTFSVGSIGVPPLFTDPYICMDNESRIAGDQNLSKFVDRAGGTFIHSNYGTQVDFPCRVSLSPILIWPNGDFNFDHLSCFGDGATDPTVTYSVLASECPTSSELSVGPVTVELFTPSVTGWQSTLSPSCQQTTITLPKYSGISEYEWIPSGNLEDRVEGETINLDGLDPNGVYTMIYRYKNDGYNCEFNEEILTINVPPAVDIDMSNPPSLICRNAGLIALDFATPTGGEYQIIGQHSNALDDDGAGNYFIDTDKLNDDFDNIYITYVEPSACNYSKTIAIDITPQEDPNESDKQWFLLNDNKAFCQDEVITMFEDNNFDIALYNFVNSNNQNLEDVDTLLVPNAVTQVQSGGITYWRLNTTDLQAGDGYYFRMRDNNKDCPSDWWSPYDVEVESAPQVTTDNSVDPSLNRDFCPEEQSSNFNIHGYTAGSGSQYNWYFTGLLFPNAGTDGDNQVAPSSRGAGDYEYIYTVYNNVCTTEYNGIITVHPEADLTLNVSDPEFCVEDQFVNLSTSGIFSPTDGRWTGDHISGPTGNQVITPGDYFPQRNTADLTYEVTDDNGCTASANITASLGNKPTGPSFSDDTFYVCQGKLADLQIMNFDASKAYYWYEAVEENHANLIATGGAYQFDPFSNFTFDVKSENINGGCVSDWTRITVIDQPLPTVTVDQSALDAICTTHEPIDLKQLFSPSYGSITSAKFTKSITGFPGVANEVEFSAEGYMNGNILDLKSAVENETSLLLYRDNRSGGKKPNITFEATLNGCTTTSKFEFEPFDGTPVIVNDNLGEFCTRTEVEDVIAGSVRIDGPSDSWWVEGDRFYKDNGAVKFLNNDTSSAGSFPVIVKATYNGCISSGTGAVTLKETPKPTIAVEPLCAGLDQIDLTTVSTVSHGFGANTSFSGVSMLSSKSVDPGRLKNFNDLDLNYNVTIDGCQGTGSTTLEIGDSSEITIFPFDEGICSDQQTAIDILSNISFSGSGTGRLIETSQYGAFIDDKLYPYLLDTNQIDANGKILADILYKVENYFGCVTKKTIDFDIVKKPVPVVDLSPVGKTSIAVTCSNDADIDVSQGYGNYDFINGTLSGDGFESNSVFQPSQAGIGTKIATWTHNIGACSGQTQFTYKIFEAPSISVADWGEYCTSAGDVNLASFVTVGAGDTRLIFSSNLPDSNLNISGLFNPAGLSTGTYPIQIAVERTNADNSKCQNTITTTISVIASENVSVDAIPEYCETIEEINIATFLNPASGTITTTSAGLYGTKFKPTEAGAGTHSFTFTPNAASGCALTANFDITVNATPNLTFTAVGEICADTTLDLIALTNVDTVNFANLYFTGDNVAAQNSPENKFFKATGIAAGNYTVTANYTDPNGCSASQTQVIVVNPLPSPTINIPEVCKNGGSFNLNNYSDLDLTWTGQGTVDNNEFNPANGDIGLNTVVARFEDNKGCRYEGTLQIDIQNFNQINVGSYDSICQDDEIDLRNLVTPSNISYTFSGSSIKNEYLYDADLDVNNGVVQIIGESANGCSDTITHQFKEAATINAEFSGINDYCEGEGSTVLLTTLTTPLADPNFSFTGDNVSNYSLNSNPAGSYVIDWTYSRNNCSITGQDLYTVHPKTELSWNKTWTKCFGSTSFSLDGALPEGGEYFDDNGKVISLGDGNYIFNALTASAGDHIVKYRYVNANGCTTIVSTTVTIEEQLEVNITDALVDADPAIFCSSNDGIRLSDVTSFSNGNGVFLNDYINAGWIYPNQMGAGQYTLDYKVTEGQCSRTVSQNFEITQSPVVSVPEFTDAYCYSAEPFPVNVVDTTINGEWSHAGGIFTGKLIDPSDLNIGYNTVTYSTYSGSCTTSVDKTLLVHANRSVTISDLDPICPTGEIELMNATPYGGTYAGPGIYDGNKIDATQLAAGDYQYTYSFTDPSTGCVTTDTSNYTVKDSLQVSITSFNTEYCASVGLIELTNGNGPKGNGTYSGPFVSNGYFDATAAGSGTYPITYTEFDGNCEYSATTNITVRPKPVVMLESFDAVCQGPEMLLDLNKITANTQNFGFVNDGISVIDGQLQRQTSGIYPIVATATDSFGCSATTTKYIQVNANPTISHLPINDVCINADIAQIQGGSSAIGTYEGTTIVNSTFINPSLGVTGDNAIKYVIVDTNSGCRAELDLTYTINDAPNANILPVLDQCSNAAVLSLTRPPMQSGETGRFESNFTIGDFLYADQGQIGSNNTLSFIVENRDGCADTATTTVTIQQAPQPQVPALEGICISGNPVTLPTGIPADGLWSGDGVTLGQFDPAGSVGNRVLTYTVTENGCTASVNATKLVYSAPAVSFQAVADRCTDAGLFDLTQYVSPQGGTFQSFQAGLDTANAIFDPSALTGDATIKYTFVDAQGCSNNQEVTFEIFEKPSLTFAPLADKCSNDNQFQLKEASGANNISYSGPGVNAGYFDPATAGAGTHIIWAKAQNNNGCWDSVSQTITVTAAPVISAPQLDNICVSGADFILSQEYSFTPIGGKFYADDVELTGNVFSPGGEGVGAHSIKYEVTDSNSCTSSVNRSQLVYTQPILSLGDIQDQCPENALISLSPLATPFGGTWSTLSNGLDTTNATFDPSQANGVVTLTYSFEDANGCANSQDLSFEVFDAADAAIANPIPTGICENATAYSLPNNNNGTWIGGNAIVANTFYPSVAGVGIFEAVHRVTSSNGCIATDTNTIEVKSKPAITVPAIDPLCQNNDEQLITGMTAGGTWSGDLISAGKIVPSSVSAGTHTATYTLVGSNGCANAETISIEILAVPNITLRNYGELCANAGEILTLSPTPTGGTFAGNGFDGTSTAIDVSEMSVGTNNYSYTVILDNGCSSTEFGQVVVIDTPDITINPIDPICNTAFAFSLEDMTSPTGGTFTADQGVRTGFAYPNELKLGDNTFTYVYTDSRTNCKSTVNFNQEVLAAPTVTHTDLDPICTTGDPFEVTGGFPQGGTYSSPIIDNGFINPSNTNFGSYAVTYSYTDQTTGCSNQVVKVQKVNRSPIVSAPAVNDLCITAEVTDLPEVTNGIWSGLGVSNNRIDPSSLSSLVTEVALTVTVTDDNGCIDSDSRTIDILDTTAIVYNPIDAICSADDAITMNYASPTGGIYDNDAVSGNQLLPADLQIGSNTIPYIYTNSNGCVSTAYRSILVQQAPNLIVNERDPVCQGDDAFILQEAFPANGLWTGEGVVNNLSFDPDEVSSFGLKPLTYSWTDPITGCSASKTVNQAVYPKPLINFDTYQDQAFCEDHPAIQLEGATPAGGDYTGEAISNGILYPELLSGTSAVVYSYTDSNGCSAKDTNTFEVLSLPTIALQSTFGPFCENEGPQMLPSILPNGGTWSGTGVRAGFVHIDELQPGINIIYYSVTQNGCTRTEAIEVEVWDSPDVAIAKKDDGAICANDGQVDLLTLLDVSPVSGTFGGGDYVEFGHINSANSGVGTFPVTWTVSNENCTAVATENITVKATPLATHTPLDAVCQNAEAFTITGGSKPGVYSGNIGVISGTILNPAVMSVQTHNLTFTHTDDVTGCSIAIPLQVVVKAPPVVGTSPIPAVCENAEAIELRDYGTPTGGQWSGDHVFTNEFYTNLVSTVGEFNLTYTVNASNGCSASSDLTMTVNPIPAVSMDIPTDFCVNEPTAILLDQGFPAGGTFTAERGIANNYLNPADAGEGPLSITYSYTEQTTGCFNTATKSIMINPEPAIGISSQVLQYCQTDLPEALTIGYPEGGWYEGNGITANTFDPSEVIPNTYEVTYLIESAKGCTASVSSSIVVNENATALLTQLPDLCLDAPKTRLSSYGFPTGGTFSTGGNGNYILNNEFYPNLAGPGLHKVVYTVTNSNGCQDSSIAYLRVNELPVIDFADTTFCAEGEDFEFTQFSPLGGTYDANTIDDGGIFRFANAQEGLNTIEYTYTDSNQCTSSRSENITVKALPVVEISPINDDAVCINGASIDLTGYGNVEGTWSGSGIIANTLFPNQTTVGTKQVTLTYTDSTTGCTNSAVRNIEINDKTTPTILPIADICLNAEAIELNTGAPSGGYYMLDTNQINFFDPIQEGTFEVTYVFTNSNGCVATTSTNVQVNPLPNLTLTPEQDYCQSVGFIQLKGENLAGGEWAGIAVQNGFFNTDNNPGNYVNTYTYTSQITGCTNQVSDTVTIKEKPSVTFDPFPTGYICVGDGPIEISEGSPANGEFISSIANDNIIDADSILGGTYTIGYAVFDQATGCSDTVSRVVEAANRPTVSVDPFAQICSNERFFAIDLQNTAGGTWTGANISNGVLALEQTGIVEATYTIYDVTTGCSNAAVSQIEVLASPSVTVNTIPEFCINDDATALNFATPSTVTYSGVGIAGQSFMPESAAVGDNPIQLTLTDGNGCTTTIDTTILVHDKPRPQFTSIDAVCINGLPINLADHSSISGSWTGPGVIDSTFDPFEALSGEHYVYLETSNDECSAMDSIMITVSAASDISLSYVGDLCVGDMASISASTNELNTGITYWTLPTGGEVLGAGYTYEQADLQSTDTIYVDHTDQNGCNLERRDTVIFTVHQPTAKFSATSNNITEGDLVGFNNLSVNATTYKWIFGDGFISTEDSAFHYYNNPGLFDVSLIAWDEFGCVDTSLETSFILVDSIPRQGTGLDEIVISELSAYPNPFTNEVTLEFFSQTVENGSLVIMDIIGRTSHLEAIQITQGTNKIVLSEEHLANQAGIIFVRVITDNQVRIAKLVKQQ